MNIASKSFARFTVSGLALAAASQASAHHAMGGRTPETLFQGFTSGLAHPVIGVDHLAFLIVVGLLAFGLRAPGRFLLPGVFVATTVAGTLVHLGAADLPMAEAVIALSVLLGGLLVLARTQLPALLLSLMVGAAGVYHGYAYGESIVGAESTPLLAYLAGFASVQYVLIVGIAVGLARLAGRSERAPVLLGRGGGVLATLVGGLFLILNLA
jgi:urease accessory protein